MSAHHTWSGRSITRSRSRYGYTRCSGLAALVRGLRYTASMPISRMR